MIKYIILLYCTCFLGLEEASSFIVPSARIINGSNVDWETTRYQVSISWADRGHQCGGALIAPNLVLTAAHCIWNSQENQLVVPERLTVLMGNPHRLVREKAIETIQLGVRKMMIAENYVYPMPYEDLALLVLKTSVPQNYPGIFIIKLNDNSDIDEGTLCTLTGWGVTEENKLSTFLKIAQLPFISKNSCINYYNNAIVKEGLFCAGYEQDGQGACTGDSGGPLVCHDKLTGIVSAGGTCGKIPSIYVDVAYYLPRLYKAIELANNQDNSIGII